MQIKIVSCIFVLESEKNDNIRKNDIQKLKVLVTKNNELPTLNFTGGELKNKLKTEISSIIGSNIFHLEQVYTMDYDSGVDIIYLAITNSKNIKKLKEDYQLIDFKIENNTVTYGSSTYNYKTIEIEENNNIEYREEVQISDVSLKRGVLNLLISYKKIRSSIDNTDIMFKFMPSSFTLEDVRQLYELLTSLSVDKSNFRKKIIKYCEKIDTKEEAKSGFRPSQRYKFKPLKGDVWL